MASFPPWLGPVIAGGIGLAGRALSDGGSGVDSNQVPPELRQLLAQAMARQSYQDPLFQAVTRQAFEGLPASARQGLSLGASLPPASLAPTSGGGGSFGPSFAGGAAGAGLASLLAGLGQSGATFDLGKVAKAIAQLFHRGNGVDARQFPAADFGNGMIWDPRASGAQPGTFLGGGPLMDFMPGVSTDSPFADVPISDYF